MFTQLAAAYVRDTSARNPSPGRRRFLSVCTRFLKAGCASLLAMGVITAANAQALIPGSFIGWGSNIGGETQLPAVSPPITDISAISSRGRNTVALRSNGRVVAWGETSGLNFPPPGLMDATAVAASLDFMMALRRDGTVVFWGNFPQAGFFLPGHLTDVTAIAANLYHAMALKRDGTIVDWSVSDGNPASGSEAVIGVVATAIAAVAR